MDDYMTCCLDFGHLITKIGWCGDDAPQGLFQSHAQKLGSDYVVKKKNLKGKQSFEIDTNVYFPFDGIEIENYDLFESVVLEGIRNSIKLDVSKFDETKVLFCSLPPRSPCKMKSKLIEILLETFGFHSILLSDQNTLSTYASGRTTSFSLSVGGGQMSLYCLDEGYGVDKFSYQCPLGTMDVAFKLYDTIKEKKQGKDLSFGPTFLSIENNMHTLPISTSAFSRNLQFVDFRQSFRLPDNSEIDLETNEIMKATEVLFSGYTSGGVAVPGIEEILRQQFDRVKEFKISDLILAGGCTLMHGFSDRIGEFLGKYCHDGVQESYSYRENSDSKRVVAPAERLFSCWIGGSILGSLSTAQRMFMTHDMAMEDSEHLKRFDF